MRSRRRRAERERSDRELLAAVMDVAGLLVIVVDPDGRIAEFNRACERTSGYSAEEAVGRLVWDLVIHRDEAAGVRAVFERIAAGEPPANHENYWIARDGSKRLIEWRNSARFDDQGRPAQIIATGIDVTERRAAEEALRQSEASLVALLEELRAIGRARDPRRAICAAALRLGEAAGAGIFEPGARAVVEVGTLSPPSEPAATVLAGGASAHEPLRLARGEGVALYEPIVHRDRVLAVLAATWARPRTLVRERLVTAIALLAAEAGAHLERAEQVERLGAQARTDELTGIANRRAWTEELPRAMARAGGAPLAVALLDLDRFKVYNDRHGHQAGDRLLRAAVAGWRAHLRPGDVLARYGGEEFALLLSGCDAKEAAEVAERLRAATPAPETCSAGLAVWDGQESADALVGRADRALYAAKEGGRDRLVSG